MLCNLLHKYASGLHTHTHTHQINFVILCYYALNTALVRSIGQSVHYTICACCSWKNTQEDLGFVYDCHLHWHFAQGSFSYSSRSAARLRTLVFLRIPPPSRTPPSRRRAASSLAYTPSSWVYRPYICVYKRQKKRPLIQVLQEGGSKRNACVRDQVFHLKIYVVWSHSELL